MGVFQHLLHALLVLHQPADQLLAGAGQLAQLWNRLFALLSNPIWRGEGSH
jgi:hypothetical protein